MMVVLGPSWLSGWRSVGRSVAVGVQSAQLRLVRGPRKIIKLESDFGANAPRVLLCSGGDFHYSASLGGVWIGTRPWYICIYSSVITCQFMTMSPVARYKSHEDVFIRQRAAGYPDCGVTFTTLAMPKSWSV